MLQIGGLKDFFSALENLNRDFVEQKNLIDFYFQQNYLKPLEEIEYPSRSSISEPFIIFEEISNKLSEDLHISNSNPSKTQDVAIRGSKRKRQLFKTIKMKNRHLISRRSDSLNDSERRKSKQFFSTFKLTRNSQGNKRKLFFTKRYTYLKMLRKIDFMNKNDISDFDKGEKIKARKLKENITSNYRMRPNYMRKRIKNYVMKYILNKAHSIINSLGRDDFLFKPDGLVYDAINEENKRLVSMTMIEILCFRAKNESHLYRMDHNSKVLLECSKDDLFNEFIQRKFDDVYVEYMDSFAYEQDCRQILLDYGRTYLNEYKNVAGNFLQFFLQL